MRTLIKTTLRRLGYEVKKLPRLSSAPNLPDASFYTPLFSPWLVDGPFKRFWELARPYTLVSADRCYVLHTLATQALSVRGDFWECGVYKGGTALLLAELLATGGTAGAALHLFDTFEGLPANDPTRDLHQQGQFDDTSLNVVKRRVGREGTVIYHQGVIPDTFRGLEGSRIAFAHIDVDLYRSVRDCCDFIMPRLTPGGFVVFDDGGFPSCPGARRAVDEFFHDRPEQPLVLPTGQAIIFARG
ncbi:MAG TPA: TylF/MycF/NovP-related O-methyltransferase [Nitrospiria bacterium]|nr:TylF/MycF/NovP-related O-methyltransferase [Nitrospiria bacterium]